MKRSKTHQIDEIAKRLFENSLPPNWIAREQHPDYGIDYIVDITESDGELTGECFAVQLKGTEKIRATATSISIPVAVKNIKYYVDKERRPVYLVVCDSVHKKSYYLQIQEYVDTLKENWRLQKKLTLHIPIKNELGKTPNLLVDLRKSDSYMKNKHPGDVGHAINHRLQELKRIDPRFNYRLEAKNNKINTVLDPVTDVSYNVTFRGKSDALSRKLDDLFGRGIPVDFSGSEIQFEGMPLFQEAFEQITMKIGVSLTVDIKLEILDSDGNIMSALPTYTNVLEGGRLEMRFDGRLPNCPVQLGVRIEGLTIGLRKIRLSIRFDESQWSGRDLLSLPYFQDIYSFTKIIRNGLFDSLRIRCLHQGSEVLTGKGGGDLAKKISDWSLLIDEVERARSVSKHFNINPKFPKEIQRRNVLDTQELSALIKNGEFECLDMRFDATADLVGESNSIPTNEPIVFTEAAPTEYEYWGVKFMLPPMQVSLRGEVTAEPVDLTGEKPTRKIFISNAICKKRKI